MLKPLINIYETPNQMTEVLSESFIQTILKTNQYEKTLHIALSGGDTPRLLFKQIVKNGRTVQWQNVHFFWVDERCVPEENDESNFGMAKKILFDKIDISPQNLHRIYGENDPTAEAKRYGNHIKNFVSRYKGSFPIFDWILLGIGKDGHTASIFPGNLSAIQSKCICGVASHPRTGQKRITLTLPVINLANRITFLVSGTQKAIIVAEILNKKDSQATYPAAMVKSTKIPVEWYLDKEAAAFI